MKHEIFEFSVDEDGINMRSHRQGRWVHAPWFFQTLMLHFSDRMVDVSSLVSKFHFFVRPKCHWFRRVYFYEMTLDVLWNDFIPTVVDGHLEKENCRNLDPGLQSLQKNSFWQISKYFHTGCFFVLVQYSCELDSTSSAISLFPSIEITYWEQAIIKI